MADTPRLRVVFDDRHLLTKSQRSAGLRHCWLLLRPHLSTVSDVADHLADSFALRRSCPDGVLLSMDGFVLPPFESTDILRDNDILWVRKKEGKKKKLLAVCDDTNVEDSLIVDRGPILSDGTTLAIRGSQEDLMAHKNKIVGNDCENGGNTVNGQAITNEEVNLKRKRNHSEKKESSKNKKLKLLCTENLIPTADEDGNVPSTHNKKAKKKDISSKSVHKTDMVFDGVERFDSLGTSKVDADKNASSALRNERHNQVGDDCCKSEFHLIATPKKSPSRSARRKKAKRQWRREAKEQIKEGKLVENDIQGTSSKQEAVNQSTEVEKEIVPIIVRPGHIRFVSEDGEVEKSKSQSNGRVETLQWNGTTSKKKGQKWGRQKTINGASKDDVCNGAIHENMNTEEWKDKNEHTDFEKLFPLTRSPMEGDVVAYRLVELSLSWCPELSPFRVGKVSLYDTVSMKIVLVPVPEYPIISNENKDAEESEEQTNSLLYKDDGSLEIEYSSLVDVRLLKSYDSEVTTVNNLANSSSLLKSYDSEVTTVNNLANSSKEPVNNWGLAMVSPNAKQSTTALSGTRPRTGWELIDQALSEKKAQLQNDGWGTWAQSTTTTTSWSYRALRGSALGPTLSLLRGKYGKHSGSSSKPPAGKYASCGKQFANGKYSKF